MEIEVQRNDGGVATDVVLLRWPAEADRREELARQGHACLLLVAEGEQSPLEWSELEDWMREPIDHVELHARRNRLRRRLAASQPVWIDEDGLLRRGPEWIALAPLEQRLLEPLLERQGSVVSRAALQAAVYVDAEEEQGRGLDGLMQRLRRRARTVGVAIHAVRPVGFLLEVTDPDP